MKKTMKEIYLEAAELIADGHMRFSCNAIAIIATGHASCLDDTAVQEYAKMYARNFDLFELKLWRHLEGLEQEEHRDFRVLLLCMMAAVNQ